MYIITIHGAQLRHCFVVGYFPIKLCSAGGFKHPAALMKCERSKQRVVCIFMCSFMDLLCLIPNRNAEKPEKAEREREVEKRETVDEALKQYEEN